MKLPPEVLRELQPPAEFLDSPWIAVGCGVLVLACVLRSVLRRPRARWIVAAVLTAVLTTATTANAIVGYVPTVAAARFLLTGTLRTDGGTLTSFTLGAHDLDVASSRTYVYLPRGYAAHPERRYPVVFLVPGNPGSSTDWFGAGNAAQTLDVLIAKGLIPPEIVVSPNQNAGLTDTECLDVPGGPQWESYLYRDLVPYVDAHYRTTTSTGSRTAGSRTIAGMSAGGYCALDQGLRHRDVWGPVVALEPFGDPGDDFPSLLGAQGFKAVSPSSYLPAMTGTVPVFLGTGAEATEKPGVDALTAQLRAKGWPVERRDAPGQGHTWLAARDLLPYGLVFAAQHTS